MLWLSNYHILTWPKLQLKLNLHLTLITPTLSEVLALVSLSLCTPLNALLCTCSCITLCLPQISCLHPLLPLSYLPFAPELKDLIVTLLNDKFLHRLQKKKKDFLSEGKTSQSLQQKVFTLPQLFKWVVIYLKPLLWPYKLSVSVLYQYQHSFLLFIFLEFFQLLYLVQWH